jgi:hypothetical protein
MAEIAEKQRLSDVAFADIEEASATRDAALAMLRHLTTIARPRDAAATLLVAVAHVASRPWLRGALRVRISAASETSIELELVEDIGGGIRTPMFKRPAGVALSELVAALPHLPLRPLRKVRQTDDTLVLGAPLRGRRGSVEPPPPSIPAPPPTGVPDIPRPPAVPREGDDGEVGEAVKEVDDGW